MQKLKAVANYSNNNDILNWNLDDPSTWTGVTWNSDGYVSEIDFSYKWLDGNLDCSDFAGLTKLNVYGNSFTEINLDNDTNLISLDCSYNNLSESGITLTDCISLNELYCDGCGLVALNLEGLSELQILSCSFNNIIALNIENNTKLNYINCQYNYLNLTNADSLYNQMQNSKATNGAYLNYYPQLITDDAVVNSDEMQALEAFAKAGDNNSKLEWLDENGNISIHKLQKNVMFEYDGSQYRITIIDISNLDVEGSLDLTAFTYLEELYCKDDKLESLNISDCSKLNILNCVGNNLRSLALPCNADSSLSKLTDVNCEYNHLDTNMFTPAIVDNVEAKPNGIIKYINQKGDSSALQAAINFANTLNKNDYSTESFEVLNATVEECNYYDFDNLYLTQYNIDELTANILTAVYNLKAYFNVNISAQNGTFTVEYDNNLPSDSGEHSILYGTVITLNAVADNECTFVGWYDTISNIYLSKDEHYSFEVDSNINIKAVIFQMVPLH